MTPPATPEAEMPRVQGDDAIRERERLAEAEAFAKSGFADWDNTTVAPAVRASFGAGYRAALRASEPVPGAVGVEEIARAIYEAENPAPGEQPRKWSKAVLASYEFGLAGAEIVGVLTGYRKMARAVLALTPRTVEPDPASGAARPCTCHPDDNPPRPCPQKYALTECREAARPSSPRDAGEAETVEQLRRERDEARTLVTEANNSLFGSQGYFHSLNGWAFDKYHLSRAIEELKAQTGRDYRRAIAAEARVADLERQLAGAEKDTRAEWPALSMIREAIETLGPVGVLPSEEAVLAQYGPEPTHEAAALVEGIGVLAAKYKQAVHEAWCLRNEIDPEDPLFLKETSRGE